MDWFLYDKDLRHETVNESLFGKIVEASVGLISEVLQCKCWKFNQKHPPEMLR